MIGNRDVIDRLTSAGGLKFDNRRARSLSYFGWGSNPGFIRLVLFESQRVIVQILRGQGSLNGSYFLALLQNSDINVVLCKDSIRTTRWQPRYHRCVLCASHRLYSLRCVWNCNFTVFTNLFTNLFSTFI